MLPENIKTSTSIAAETSEPAATAPEPESEPLAPGIAETAGAAAIMSGVHPDSTTAALAAEVPKEGESSLPEPTPASENNFIPGGWTETPALDLNKQIGVNPLPASEGPGNPVSLAPGEKIPESVHQNNINSKVTLDKESYDKAAGEPEQEESTFGVAPIPATEGAGNPVKLAPGEPVPENIHSNTVESTATTDKESYDKAGSAALGGAVLGGAAAAGAGAFAVSEEKKNLIPESSIPMGESTAPETLDAGPTVQSAAPTSTTAELAAAVPKEPRGTATVIDDSAPAAEVPEVVKESIAEAHAEPEAAASEDKVEEKAAFEKELLSEVKTENATGEPAPVIAAETSATAPEPTAAPETTSAPTVTDGITSSTVPETTTAETKTEEPTTASTTNGASTTVPAAEEGKKKKKNRLSAFLGKLKGKKN